MRLRWTIADRSWYPTWEWNVQAFEHGIMLYADTDDPKLPKWFWVLWRRVNPRAYP